SPWESTIISVKDYDFGSSWPAEPVIDFNYPAIKPPKTYRILMVGDSRLVTCPTVIDQVNYTPSQRINTAAKQLEFILNTEAALHNVDTRFEVLMLGHVNQNPLIFGNYEVPELVKKYDVDMVFMMTSMKITDFFYQKWTSEGIP